MLRIQDEDAHSYVSIIIGNLQRRRPCRTTAGFAPTTIMPGYRGTLIGAMSTFLVVDGVALAARVYVRTRMLHRIAFGLDELVLRLTYSGFGIACAMGFTSMAYGLAAEEKRAHHDKDRATQASWLYECRHGRSGRLANNQTKNCVHTSTEQIN